MLDRFTEEARQALVMAQQAARGLRYDSLDSGAMLLGLLTDHADAAVRALAQQGIHFEAVREQVAARRPPVFATEQKRAVPYTAESMALIDRAFLESKRLRHRGTLSSGHLVLAMMHTPESLAAQALQALGADPAPIELAVAAGHVPSAPQAGVVPSEEFHRMLVHQASLAWPRPRAHVASAVVSVLWYLGTLAFIVTGTVATVGPELVIGLAVASLLALAVFFGYGSRRAGALHSAGSSLVESPPELRALVARWGIKDFAIWLRDDFRLEDHAVRIGAKAGIGVSREVFNRPAESGFVVAHELAHLLRNDSARGLIDRCLRWGLVVPALVTADTTVWFFTAVSLVLHGVVKNWWAELDCDRIAVSLHGYEQMVSFADRTHTFVYWPGFTHPPYLWRMWFARRAIS